MANAKISALSTILGADVDPAADLAVVVDSSASQNKKITVSELFSVIGFSVHGLVTSNNATDADHDIDIAVGAAKDTTSAAIMTRASVLTKRIDASWAVGTNMGGLDGTESVAGTPDADTWYYVWLIQRSDTGVVDALFSESSTAPTMPTNYNRKQKIMRVRTNSLANIIPYYQFGNVVYWQAHRDILNGGGATGATTLTTTSAVPPDASAFFATVSANQSHLNQSDSYMYVNLRVAAGVDWMVQAAFARSGSGNAQNHDVAGPYRVPHTGTFQYYNVPANVTGHSTEIRVLGFEFER